MKLYLSVKSRISHQAGYPANLEQILSQITAVNISLLTGIVRYRFGSDLNGKYEIVEWKWLNLGFSLSDTNMICTGEQFLQEDLRVI